MTVFAGNVIYASDINNVAGRQFDAACTLATTVGTAAADVTGASITFTTTTAGAKVHATWAIDNNITVAGAGVVAIGFLSIDGTDDNNRQALCSLDDVHRLTITQHNLITLVSAGSHTIKLRCQKTGAGGTDQLQAGHTNLNLIVYENV